jgi:hypothetical protein
MSKKIRTTPAAQSAVAATRGRTIPSASGATTSSASSRSTPGKLPSQLEGLEVEIKVLLLLQQLEVLLLLWQLQLLMVELPS